MAWCAPEILKGSKATYAADIFSFGVLLWEIMTGKRPTKNAIKNRLSGELEDCVGISTEFATLITRCWATEPRERPSVNEILTILKQCAPELTDPQKLSSPIHKLPSSVRPFLQDSSLITDVPKESSTDAKLHQSFFAPAPKKEPAPMSDSGGQILLDFTICFTDLTFGDPLGQGSYGKVFAGKWKFNTVAIKQYLAQDFSEQIRQAIRKEAMMMATVSTQSDYLVRLRGIVLEKPHYSLVMEYLPGGDLFHLLKSSEPLAWPRRYQIGRDMTIGLHHLHERGVLHRDLKSLNVLLGSSGRAKLADFGLSTLKTSSASTTADGFKGTVLWSAPELFKPGAKATVASDIYSLGMVLWELASRKTPFTKAASPMIAMNWIMSGMQEIIPEGTPEEFKQLIEICWDKEPSKRPTADIIVKRLDGLLENEHKEDEKISVETHLPSPKFVQTESSKSEVKKLQEDVIQLKLEQDNQQLLKIEKRTSENAQLNPELEQRGEEAKEIHLKSKDKPAPITYKASHQDPYLLAKHFHEKRDYVQARIYYEEALQHGNKSARNKLATLLMRGQGGPVDEKAL